MSLYGGLQTGMLQAKTETAVGIVVFYMQRMQKISPFPSNVVKVSSLILISVLAGHEVHNDWTRHRWTGNTQQRCWHQRMQILAQACGL